MPIIPFFLCPSPDNSPELSGLLKKGGSSLNGFFLFMFSLYLCIVKEKQLVVFSYLKIRLLLVS